MKTLFIVLFLFLPALCFAGRSFNGSTDCISTGVSLFAVNTTETALVKYSTLPAPGSNKPITSQWNGTATTDFIWVIDSTPNTFVQVNAVNNGASASGVTTNSWAHAGFKYHANGATSVVTWYIKGVNKGSNNTYNAYVSNSFTFNIASDQACAHNAPLAESEVAVWTGSASTAFTNAEMDALGHMVPAVLVHGGTGLVNYWPLHGLHSPEPDMSGTSHTNGTLHGTTAVHGAASTSWTSTPQQLNVY